MKLFFATAARGTEMAVESEARRLGLRDIARVAGGIRFRGPMEDGYRACLELRCAMRVLVRLAVFDARDGEELYDGVRAVDFSEHLDEGLTISVRASASASELYHTQFIAQKTKDAVVDQIRDRRGARPDVDRDDADFVLFLHLFRDKATLYADMSGHPLFQRGYRTEHGEAPLKETLAASLLELVGAPPGESFSDPLCGSGTIAIEAALRAARRAPGLTRPSPFGFERWRSHDAAARDRFAELVAAARARVVADHAPIFGADLDPAAIAIARRNAARARVAVTFETRDATQGIDHAETIVSNPPYGGRLTRHDSFELRFAEALSRANPSRLGLLDENQGYDRIDLDIVGRHALMNGEIACTLMIFRGARRRRVS